MGFFDNLRAINKINTLLKQIEPKLEYIAEEIKYPQSANRIRLRNECGTVSVLMNEIMEIIGNSSESVLKTPYYYKGRKLSIIEISSIAALLLERAERI